MTLEEYLEKHSAFLTLSVVPLEYGATVVATLSTERDGIVAQTCEGDIGRAITQVRDMARSMT